MRYTNAQYTLLLSKICNLHCPYCFATGPLRGLSADTLTFEELQRFVTFAYTPYPGHEKIITLVGGEPSLHPDFIEMVDFLIGQQFHVKIFTNGIWPPRMLDWFLNLNESRRSRVGLLVNYNHDLPKPQRERVNWFCANVLPRFPSTIGLNVHCVDRQHLKTIDRCAGFKVNSIRVGISQPIGGQGVYVRFEDYPQIGAWICQLLQHAAQKKLRLYMDCSHPYCMFDEQQHRFLERLQSSGQLRRYNPDCVPPLLIGPGLQTWRCYNAHDISEGKTIDDFCNVSEFEHYYSRKLNHWNVGLFADRKCRTCRYRIERLCRAGCAGFVPKNDAEMLEHIRNHVAAGLMNCIFTLNQAFLDRITRSRDSFSLYSLGRRYKMPRKPYWEILDTIDGQTSFGEILSKLGIALRPNQRKAIVKLIEAKILTVLTIP